MAIFHHVLVYIFISNCCFLIRNPSLIKSFIKPQIGHNRSHYSMIVQLPVFIHIFPADIQDQVSVDHVSVFVHCNTTVCIAVIGKTYVQFLFLYQCLQCLDMSRSAGCVDISAIGIVVDHIGFRSKSIKYAFGNGGGTTVGTIKTNAIFFKGPGSERNQITDITVTPCHIIYGTADLLSGSIGNLFRFAVNILLDQLLYSRFHLMTVAIDDLNAIVIEGIMACRNHDTAVKLFGAHYIRYTGCGSNMQQICVSS